MKKPSKPQIQQNSLKDKIMGLGEKSMRKSYYPELQKRIRELEESNEKLQQLIREKDKAQKELAESQALLSDIIHYQPAGTYRIRLHKNYNPNRGIHNKFSFDFLSQKFCDITGVKKEDIINDPFKMLKACHPADRESFVSHNNVSIENFSPFFWVGRFVVQGQVRWVQIESYPRLLSNGEKVWTGVIIDFTARKKADEDLRISEERFRLIFENSPVGMFSYDEKGCIRACNTFFADIIGLPKDRLTGLNMQNLPSKPLVETLQKALKGQSSAYEGGYTSSLSGREIKVRLQFAPIMDKKGAVQGGVGIAENIEDRIRNEKLKQEVEIARKSVEFKQKFLANMSHEIRTPLTGIEGMAYILAQTPLNKTQQDYLDTIIASSQGLREIINQILDYSKIEAGRMTIKPRIFRFEDIARKAEKLFASLCTHKIPWEVKVSPILPQYIEADEQRLMQIIINFISNAVKYAPQGLITLEIAKKEACDTETPCYRISVTDQGEGIENSRLEQIFLPFSQLDQTSKEVVEGTGLGLAICKELAELMGGEIGVESQPGKGSCFWFTFRAPTAKQPRSAEPEQYHSLSLPSRLKILLVEDKVVNQKVISLMLNGMGHEVQLASNGQEALKAYRPGVFDLILMDINMPVMDGITATSRLRSTFDSLPPIVGLSANAFEGDREKYIGQGLDDYLTKPVSKKEFAGFLQKWFS